MPDTDAQFYGASVIPTAPYPGTSGSGSPSSGSSLGTVTTTDPLDSYDRRYVVHEYDNSAGGTAIEVRNADVVALIADAGISGDVTQIEVLNRSSIDVPVKTMESKAAQAVLSTEIPSRSWGDASRIEALEGFLITIPAGAKVALNATVLFPV